MTQGSSTNITYKVINNTRVTRTLTLVPTSGISQATTGAGSCASPFTLAMGKSCFLNLKLNSKQLPALVNGGPEVCKTYGSGNNAPDPFLCSQPSAQNSLHITIVPPKPIMAAVGQYFDNTPDGTLRPLLAMTQDNGASWTYPSSITQPTLTPAFSRGGLLSSVFCSGTFCVAAGKYGDGASPSIQHPLLAITHDNGSSWKFPASITQPTLNPAFAFGELDSVSCSGLTCVTVGQFQDKLTARYPLLFLSQDGGSSWSSPASIAHPSVNPIYRRNGILFSVSCSGTVCIAGGNYEGIIGGIFASPPLLALSQNGGTSWTFPLATSQPDVTPAYNDLGTYKSVSCNGNTCIAGGQYYDGFIVHPMIAVSQDKGSSWSFPASITQPALTPAYGEAGDFNSVSCSTTTCIAGGNYLADPNDPTSKRPLLALSQDKGITWTFPSEFTSPVLTPAYNSFGTILGVNCNGNICLAVGSYFNALPENSLHPLLAVSQDKGSTWTFPASISQPTLTPAFSIRSLVSASCNNNICLASGSYTDKAGLTHPLVAQSRDNGVTWTFPKSVSVPALTPGLSPQGGTLSGISANASMLSPALSMLQQN